MRGDWLQATQRLDCKPRDSLEHSGKYSLEKERWGRELGWLRNLQTKPLHLRLREWRTAAGVWKDPTQTWEHHFKANSNPKTQEHPDADWHIQWSCSWNQDGDHPQAPSWCKTGSNSNWYYPGKTFNCCGCTLFWRRLLRNSYTPKLHREYFGSPVQMNLLWSG